MTTDRAAGGGLVPARQSSRVARVGATIQFALGAGFGIGAAATLAYFARNGELPMTPWGFRSMSGPFERLGPTAFARLGWGLVGVCALDVVAARWLWQGRRRGLRLGLATAPPALVLGAGFALPFLLVGIPIRVLLAVVSRQGLR